MGVISFFKKDHKEQAAVLRTKVLSIFSLPFRFGRTFFNYLYISYLPDSLKTDVAKNEFLVLLDRFSKHHTRNNSGDIPRLISFMLNCKQIITEGIPGDFAELGVYRGNTAAILAYYARRAGRKVYLFDTYEGFHTADLQGIDAEKKVIFEDTSLSLVEEVIGPEKDMCEFVKGYFPDSLTPKHRTVTYSIVSLDCDLYEPMKAGLEFFYPRMSKGGVLFLHDYSSTRWDGAKMAVDEFTKKTGEFVILMPDKSGSAFIRKSS